MNDLRRAGVRLRQGELTTVVNAAGQRLYSSRIAVGLRRDLMQTIKAPQAKIPVTIRPLAEHDYPALQAACRTSATAAEKDEVAARLRMLQAGMMTCYAAVDTEDTVCYVQWLLKSEDNHVIQGYFRGAVPPLRTDEALIEGAYSLPSFRGLGIMACAMAQIAAKASDFGARWVITFVGRDNVASMKGCKSAGFAPFLVRRECWRLLRRRFVFEPFAEP